MPDGVGQHQWRLDVQPIIHLDDRVASLNGSGQGSRLSSSGTGRIPPRPTAQMSRWGVVRGVHFAIVPPGQAKYVTCVSGATST